MAHEGIQYEVVFFEQTHQLIKGVFHTAFSLLATEILQVGCQDTLRHPWLHQEIDVNGRLRCQKSWFIYTFTPIYSEVEN